jgi:hypothetical protein
MNPLIQLKKTLPLLITLTLFCFALSPTAQAVSPAPDGGYPGGNTAEGQNALFSLTSGGYNTAVGFFSLRSNATGQFNTATGAGTLPASTADENTATGAGALLSNTTVFVANVNAMLLNEFLKEHKKTEKLEATVASLSATVKEQAAQIQKVSAQLETVNLHCKWSTIPKPRRSLLLTRIAATASVSLCTPMKN